jgi:hypothetical protein
VVLAAAAGWALQRFAGIEHAVPVALLLGLVVAALVPARASCSLPDRGARGTRGAG